MIGRFWNLIPRELDVFALSGRGTDSESQKINVVYFTRNHVDLALVVDLFQQAFVQLV